FSSGAQRIVVNCGTPRLATQAVLQASRSTVAHSTASINDVSSCQIVAMKGNWLDRLAAAFVLRRVGPVMINGPETVAAERGERDEIQTLTASHDGYRDSFRLTHERRWQMAPDGEVLEGEDLFWGEGTGS